MKKYKKVFIGTILSFVFLLSSTLMASAAVTHQIKQGDDGLYKYDLAAVRSSFTASVMNPDSVGALLYNDYLAKGAIVAVADTERDDYVDFSDVRAAFTRSILTGSDFSVPEYISNEAATYNVTLSLKEVIIEDGQIVYRAIGDDDENNVAGFRVLNIY